MHLMQKMQMIAIIGIGLFVFRAPVLADGTCERPSQGSSQSRANDVGWCRLHERGPAGEAVYIFTDQNHSHKRPRHVYVSYNRSKDYRRLLFDCETRMYAQVSPGGRASRYQPVVPPLYAEIYESVCMEKNAIIPTPFNDTDKWPDAPVPPPASL
ncbi:MAG: hypothetical protein ACKO45_09220 [Cyanobium sp.]